MRSIKKASELAVDLEKLRHAFETGSADLGWFLDSKTGEVASLSRLTDNPDGIEDLIAREPARYWAIPPASRLDLYADMARFTAAVSDSSLAGRLDMALHGADANRRFKDLLAADPRENDRWVEFRAEQMRQRALDWLQGLGIDPA